MNYLYDCKRYPLPILCFGNYHTAWIIEAQISFGRISHYVSSGGFGGLRSSVPKVRSNPMMSLHMNIGVTQGFAVADDGSFGEMFLQLEPLVGCIPSNG